MRLFKLVFAATFGLLAQQPGQIRTGPDVGSVVPAFEAPDQKGQVKTLESVAGPQGAVLVFYRSADW
jgi:hypothetical protein